MTIPPSGPNSAESLQLPQGWSGEVSQQSGQTIAKIKVKDQNKEYSVTLSWAGPMSKDKIQSYIQKHETQAKIQSLVGQYRLFEGTHLQAKSNLRLVSTGSETKLLYTGKGNREKTIDLSTPQTLAETRLRKIGKYDQKIATYSQSPTERSKVPDLIRKRDTLRQVFQNLHQPHPISPPPAPSIQVSQNLPPVPQRSEERRSEFLARNPPRVNAEPTRPMSPPKSAQLSPPRPVLTTAERTQLSRQAENLERQFQERVGLPTGFMGALNQVEFDMTRNLNKEEREQLQVLYLKMILSSSDTDRNAIGREIRETISPYLGEGDDDSNPKMKRFTENFTKSILIDIGNLNTKKLGDADFVKPEKERLQKTVDELNQLFTLTPQEKQLLETALTTVFNTKSGRQAIETWNRLTKDSSLAQNPAIWGAVSDLFVRHF